MMNEDMGYRLLDNTSKVFYDGSKWCSNNCGQFTIVGHTDRCYISKDGYLEYKYYLCKFEDGTVVEARTSQIKKGTVRNPNCPSICERGYLGEGRWKFYINQKPTKEYRLFLNILNRCYNPNANAYSEYGGQGVTLSSDLFNFQNFCNMISHLPHYEDWKSDQSGDWQIDKDLLCDKLNIDPKIYSSETCCFITRQENISERNKRVSVTGKTYIGISPTGEKYEFANIKQFSREHNLQDTHIGNCIHGKVTQHKGWTFSIKSTS